MAIGASVNQAVTDLQAAVTAFQSAYTARLNLVKANIATMTPDQMESYASALHQGMVALTAAVSQVEAQVTIINNAATSLTNS